MGLYHNTIMAIKSCDVPAEWAHFAGKVRLQTNGDKTRMPGPINSAGLCMSTHTYSILLVRGVSQRRNQIICWHGNQIVHWRGNLELRTTRRMKVYCIHLKFFLPSCWINNNSLRPCSVSCFNQHLANTSWYVINLNVLESSICPVQLSVDPVHW